MSDMHDTFDARNELEQKLLAAQEVIGISINPNWPVGMDLEPEMVQQLKNN